MFSRRTRLSIVQLLRELLGSDVEVLLQKHCIDFVAGSSSYNFVSDLKESLLRASEDQVRELIEEMVRTRGTIRYKFSTKYVFEEHWRDLDRSLQLDGFRTDIDARPEKPALIAIDPTVVDQPVVEDDLTVAIERSGLVESERIIKSIRASADHFRAETPDYNASLTHARIALHELAKAIASEWKQNHPGSYQEEKWGQVIDFLRTREFIDWQEEDALTSTYSLVSPGTHTLLSLSESETTRLGRTLFHSMAYFLTKRWLDKSGRS